MNAELKFELPALPEVVFAHFTDADLLVRWWPTGAESSLEPGGEYHLWWDGPGWHLRGRYLAIEPPSALSFTWQWDHEETPERTVEIAISEGGEGSMLAISHEAGSDEERSGYVEGWEHFVAKLRSLLDSDD